MALLAVLLVVRLVDSLVGRVASLVVRRVDSPVLAQTMGRASRRSIKFPPSLSLLPFSISLFSYHLLSLVVVTSHHIPPHPFVIPSVVDPTRL